MNNPVFYLTKKTWEFSVGQRYKVVLFFLLHICSYLMSFLQPLIIVYVLNFIQENGVNAGNLYHILGTLSLILLVDIAFWVFHWPARYLEITNSFIVRAQYKKYLLDGTLHLPPQWHSDHHSGDTIDKIEKGTQALHEYAGHHYEIIETVVRFTSSYLALAYFNLHASYIVLFIALMAILMVLKFDVVLRRCWKELNVSENRISSKVFDVISNITTVIILRVEKLVSKAMFKKIMKPYDLFKYTTVRDLHKWFLVTICASLMMVTVLGSYVWSSYTYSTPILMGTLYALYEYVSRISGLFYRFTWKYSDILYQYTKVENAEEVSNEFKDILKEHTIPLGDTWNQLVIEGLTFSYEGKKDELHLNNVHLNIQRKQKIALIGESGSGKTTFLKLLRGLYTPQHMNLFLDGELLHHGFDAISDHITLIPQDPELFSTTIKENITLGVPHTTDTLMKYARLASFSPVIKRLPKGLHSFIHEKGVNLSGGEKQRLALARGLLACEGKSIILLDEPTSSVDTKNELQIYKNIFNTYKTKTIISTIHRLHLLPLFDQIYLFSKGKIVAAGTYRELLRRSPEFRKIWKKYRDASK